MQRLRYGANYTNAIVPIKLFEEKVVFSESQLNQVATTCYEQKLSNRSTMKILRLARTISDLAGDLFVSIMPLMKRCNGRDEQQLYILR